MEMEPAYRKKYLVYGLFQQIFFNPYFIKQLIRRNPGVWRQVKNQLAIIWQALFGPKMAFEVVYSLVASRWVFREFKNDIGIIGNEAKVGLIKKLMEKKGLPGLFGCR